MEVPDIGDFEDVPVIEILVSVGDSVAVEDPLVTLESDKATMDVPAPFAGVVREINVSIGDRVSEGSLLMSIEGSDSGGGDSGGGDPGGGEPAEAAAAMDHAAEQTVAPAESVEAPGAEEQPARASAPSEPAAQAPPEPAAPAQTPAPPADTNGAGPIYASPSARRLARELGVDLRSVSGSGRKGRITKEDVQNLADGQGAAVAAPGAGAGGPGAGGAGGAGVGGLDLLPWPTVDFEKLGPVERVERSRIQRISAPNLARNWVMIPHVTHNDEADITELEAWRKRLNEEYAREDVKFTMVSFLVAACVAALKEFPTFNSSLDGDELVLKRYYNIGFAADTPGGLVVPVIKGADGKGLKEIATELTDLSGRAREGKLKVDEMRGATFTISSLGGIGGTS
ncbi:MAG TPA: 2-oxo acid dehydrogenase subunit E2, partial [Solirubrobacteraceae bacterium]|nr:2-oxo acid dehydrogenase subunit E2 [Solirubrobacteraceae bacterium]